MEYIYAAMLLHTAGKKVDDKGVKKVLDAAGVKTDAAQVKALVSALDGVNIEEAMEKAVAAPAAAAPAAASAEAPTEAKAEKKEETSKEDEAKAEESAAAGMGALFG